MQLKKWARYALYLINIVINVVMLIAQIDTYMMEV